MLPDGSEDVAYQRDRRPADQPDAAPGTAYADELVSHTSLVGAAHGAERRQRDVEDVVLERKVDGVGNLGAHGDAKGVCGTPDGLEEVIGGRDSSDVPPPDRGRHRDGAV